MNDYLRYLRNAKGDAPDPLHAALIDLLMGDAGRARTNDSGGSGNGEPPPRPTRP